MTQRFAAIHRKRSWEEAQILWGNQLVSLCLAKNTAVHCAHAVSPVCLLCNSLVL